MPVVNLDPVHGADEGYPPVPAGVYQTRVRECKETVAHSGAPMWTLIHEVIEGPESAPDSAYVGRRIWDRITWSPGGMPRVKLVLKRLGLEIPDAEVDWTPDVVEGLVARVQVVIGEYDGKRRNDIPFAGYLPMDGKAVVGSSPDGRVADPDDIPF